MGQVAVEVACPFQFNAKDWGGRFCRGVCPGMGVISMKLLTFVE